MALIPSQDPHDRDPACRSCPVARTRPEPRASAQPADLARWRNSAGATLGVWVAVVLLLLAGPPWGLAQSGAQEPANPIPFASREGAAVEPHSATAIDGFPIVLDGSTIEAIHHGVAGFSAQERAQAINRRLQRFAQDEALPVDALTIQHNADDNSFYLGVGQDVLLTVTQRDAQARRLDPKTLAEQSLQTIQRAVTRYRQDRKPAQLFRNTVYAVIASLAYLVFGFVVLKGSGQLFPLLRRWISLRVPGIKVNNVELITPSAISAFWLQVLGFVRLVLLLIAFFYCAAFILRLYPWSRAIGESSLGYFYGAVELVLASVANYLPNLFIVSIIAFLAYYTLRVLKPFFLAIDRGSLVIPGFYADWGRPTYNLLMVLVIALATVLAFPYLPGFHSPAFQGISVFLGLLLSLGSTSVVTNVVGGVILTYTRAFRLGDHIRVGDVIGDIIEKNFLAIRICTPANQVITIPNAALLNNNVTNYNLSTRELSRSLILQTTITLGYDVPWRQAHSTLVEAALATTHILADPPPFVLQTTLGNDTISYQLNAYTSQPNLMVFIYSELHQQMQDKFNQQGIEILSPSYLSLRDGRASTLPRTGAVSGEGTPPTPTPR